VPEERPIHFSYGWQCSYDEKELVPDGDDMITVDFHPPVGLKLNTWYATQFQCGRLQL
jgi:hypothetical protein